ncbi:hypothetical protein [Brevundimonas sp. GCM10030266]|uniref:hypothetical protein n=1 Tax=Brevundimonas sp. GCM10030266 TaxID=3273386 RepID=UPI00360A1459
MNSTKTIYERLIGAPDVVAALDVFDGLPAIFEELAPDDYLAVQEKFCIVIAAPSSDIDASTLTDTAREVVQDVRSYARISGSVADLGDFARAVRDLFHARPDDLTVEGGRCSLVTATGPVAAPTTDPSLVGRRVSLRLLLERN